MATMTEAPPILQTKMTKPRRFGTSSSATAAENSSHAAIEGAENGQFRIHNETMP